MVEAIAKELKLQKAYLKNEEIDTIYFGGGTPSLLSKKALLHLLHTIFNQFNVNNQVEITLEANPDDLSLNKLEELKQVGINRLSIGVQSFHQAHLEFMNRAHNASEAQSCLEWVSKADFDNFSVDLIYGIPGSDHAIWQSDLETLIAFKPTHISSYCLTIEDNTVFGKWKKTGKLHEASDEYSAEQFQILVSTLKNAGYNQYEVSNFSLPGFESKHNSSYWQQKIYLGVGPGAHSFDLESRQFNVANNAHYLKSLEMDIVPFEKEVLSKADKLNEYLMTSLRTDKGANLLYLQESLQFDLKKAYGSTIQDWISSGWAYEEENQLILTTEGRLLADKLASDLFVESL